MRMAVVLGAGLCARACWLADGVAACSGEDVFSGVRSFINFEVLPLVEFEVSQGITAHDADALLGTASSANKPRAPAGPVPTACTRLVWP